MSLVSPVGSEAGSSGGAPAYARHRPEQTLLYRLVEEHYPAFKAHLAAQGSTLPRHVAREFEDFLACGRLEHGFLRVACDGCRAEHLVAFSCKRRGFCPSCGAFMPVGYGAWPRALRSSSTRSSPPSPFVSGC